MHERPVSNGLRTSTFASILAKRYHVKRKPKLLLAFRDFQTELPAVPTKQLLLDLKSRAEPERISIRTGLRTLVEQFMAYILHIASLQYSMLLVASFTT